LRSRWTAKHFRIITKPRTGKSSKKASVKPVRWRRYWPLARATLRMACRWFRFIFTTRCSGRTTLNGEGLQHQDGHSLLHVSTIPTCLPYDPAFSYELAVIVTDGLRRMYVENEDIFYYLAVYNEN